MSAIQASGHYWGGAGFILVPFDPASGIPSPEFASIVRAYDPDHVVNLQIPVQRFEELYPGHIQIQGVADEAERVRLINNGAWHHHVESSALTARDQVAKWCSPMRLDRLSGEGVMPMEQLTTMDQSKPVEGFSGVLTRAASREGKQTFSAAPHWRSDIGLFAALRFGVAEDEVLERPEPPESTIDWLIRRDGVEPPTDFLTEEGSIRSPTLDRVEPLFLAGQRLVAIRRGFIRDGAALVIGDTAADFALAVAFDRMLGRAVWLASELLNDTEAFRRRTRFALQSTMYDVERGGDYFAVTSTSVSNTVLEQLVADIEESNVEVLDSSGTKVPLRAHESMQIRPPNLESGILFYSADEHVGALVTIPVTHLPDGTQESLMGLQTPIPSNLLFAENSGHVPYWYVDVETMGGTTPTARDLPSSAVAVQPGPFPEVNIRASRNGYSFNPQSMGFVPAGALLTSRIGRPRLRFLSITAWVQAMAERGGFGVRPSSAGRQAKLLQARLGSRAALLEMTDSDTLRMFRAFKAVQTKPKPEEQDPDVVVVDLDPHLSFEAISSLVGGTQGETMDLIDRLVTTRILRRGLILGCADCGRLSFVLAERLGGQFDCSHCGTANTLVSERWNRESPEPRWFYDLYSTFRELLAANGDAVLLAAAALKRSAREYDDTSELEFINLETESPVAEVDIIASVDGKVVVVEAKSNGTFQNARTRRAQCGKLIKVATLLRADRIVLATTNDEWTAADVDHLRAEAERVRPFPLEVEVLTGLG